MIKPDKLVIAAETLGKGLAEINGQFVYWKGNDEASTELVDADSLQKIEALYSQKQAEYDAQAYARSRVQEYPPIGDQLDALFKAGVFPADMAAAIQAVKDKYPKGTA